MGTAAGAEEGTTGNGGVMICDATREIGALGAMDAGGAMGATTEVGDKTRGGCTRGAAI